MCSSCCVRQISCTKALKDWESKEGNQPLAEATVVRIYGGVPYEDGGKQKRAFITKLDNGLNGLKECTCVSRYRATPLPSANPRRR